jgi:hypothetical protein
VPRERGRVVFSYRPRSVVVGAMVSAVGVVALAGLVLARRFRSSRIGGVV